MAQVQVPFSYVQQVRSPAQALLQGYQTGLQRQEGLRQAALAEEDRRMKAEDRARRIAAEDRQLAAEMAAQQQAAQFREQFSAFAKAPNKTASQYAELIAMAPKEMVSSITSAYEAMTEEELAAQKRQAGQLIAALKMDPAQGLEILDTRIEAAKNAGLMEEAQGLIAYRKVAENDPQAVIDAVALQAGMAFGDEFFDFIAPKAMQEPPGVQAVLNNFPDGTVQFGMKDASVVVRGPDQQLHTGADAARVLAQAQENKFKTDVESVRGKKEAGELIKIAAEQFKQYDAVQKQIGLYDEALTAIDRGAETGLLKTKFYDVFDAQTRELNRISRALGLEILNLYTFGALSAPELETAMRVGGLDLIQDKEVLKAQIKERREARVKLLFEIQRAIQEASKRGQTLGEYAESVNRLKSEVTSGKDIMAEIRAQGRL